VNMVVNLGSDKTGNVRINVALGRALVHWVLTPSHEENGWNAE
jgi:hypothetical protein